jgi:5-methylcytosine-specific restriction protein A
VSAVPKPIRHLVRGRDKHACARCGTACPPGTGSLHHRRPRGAGGSRSPLTNDPANLVLLCGTGTTGCHGLLESHRTTAYAAGWLLRQWQNPLTEPVYRHGAWQQPGERWRDAEPPSRLTEEIATA